MDEEAVCRTEMACHAIMQWCRANPAEAVTMLGTIQSAIAWLQAGRDAINEFNERRAA